MMLHRLALCLSVGLMLRLPAPLSAQDQPTRTEKVRFAPGTTGATLSGTIVGREFVTYTLGAEAGQQISVSLTSANTSVYFNLYEPGRAPGDEALAIGEMTPVTNLYDGILPTSGIYTISVFLYRNAARDGETVDYALNVAITGKVDAVVKGDFADGLMGGPDFWEVATTGGGTLKLHATASTGGAEVARLPRGEAVRNLGCRMNEGRQWCQVATLDDPGVEGWAAAEFLREGAPPEGVASQLPDMIPVETDDAPVPGTEFNATGQIECVPDQDAPSAMCDFGVVREGNGNGSLTIFWPDGDTRVIRIEDGTPVSYEPAPQDAGAEMTVTREGDNSIVFIGSARFVIPDAVIFGG